MGGLYKVGDPVVILKYKNGTEYEISGFSNVTIVKSDGKFYIKGLHLPFMKDGSPAFSKSHGHGPIKVHPYDETMKIRLMKEKQFAIRKRTVQSVGAALLKADGEAINKLYPVIPNQLKRELGIDEN